MNKRDTLNLFLSETAIVCRLAFFIAADWVTANATIGAAVIGCAAAALPELNDAHCPSARQNAVDGVVFMTEEDQAIATFERVGSNHIASCRLHASALKFVRASQHDVSSKQ